jgi:hypothetical protein
MRKIFFEVMGGYRREFQTAIEQANAQRDNSRLRENFSRPKLVK